jgi:N-methylhydantoinase B
VELQEALYPVFFESIALRTDSGGAGEYRGGLGVSKRVQVLQDCHLNVSMDRTRCPPWGVNSGCDGASGQVILNPGSEREEHLKKADRSLKKGDLVKVDSGGGGGFGHPTKRSYASIAQDLLKGYVSEEAAKNMYGYQVQSDH